MVLASPGGEFVVVRPGEPFPEWAQVTNPHAIAEGADEADTDADTGGEPEADADTGGEPEADAGKDAPAAKRAPAKRPARATKPAPTE